MQRAARLERVGPAQKLNTYDDLLRLPEGVKAEILAGEWVTNPAPLPEHGWIQGSLARGVGGPFDGDGGHGGNPGGWWILMEVDVRFTMHDIVRPDLAGWKRQRLPNPFGQRPLEVVPDWVCEIASPSNARYDRVEKRALYAAHGVQHYWMVEPAARVHEALKLREGSWVELGAWSDTGGLQRIEPFDAIELDLGKLFPPQLG